MIIKDAINRELRTIKHRFCTPGHKGALYIEDITESDVFPANAITEAQRKAADLIGVKHIRFLLHGSSLGIKAALMASGDIIAGRNSHQSVVQATVLGRNKAFLIENTFRDGLALPLTARQLKEAIKEYPSAKTVVLTSPDYYGLIASVDAAKFVKDTGRMLYIDAAHGAHFPMRPDLFDCEIFRYADAFNLSAHKTLPSLTQTAYLAINNDMLLPRVDINLSLLGTTSPLYPLYSSLEYALEYTLKNKNKYDALKDACLDFKKNVRAIDNGDFTRLIVDAGETGAAELYNGLRERGILAEKYDKRYVVFIVSIMDKPKDIYRLKEEICRILSR